MTESKKKQDTTKHRATVTIDKNTDVPHKEPVECAHMGKYDFSSSELAKMAVELTRHVREKTQAEDELQGIRSSFKATIDGHNLSINKISTDHGNGYEWRNMECVLSFDFKNKRRIYRRRDTGAIIANEPMTASDFQTDAFGDGG